MKSVTEPQSFCKRAFLRKIGLFFVVCIMGMVTFSSCNKDDDEDDSTTKLSMTGNLSYSLPLYAKAGDTFEMVGGGIISPSADSVSYTWTSAHLLADTTKGTTCKVIVPDSVGTFSLTLTAVADGYYTKSYTMNLTSVKSGPDGSLSDLSLPETTITDERDNQVYAVTEIGSLLWFAQNLNWAGAGSGYAKTDIMGDVIGRLYTWKDATGGESGSGLAGGPQGVCPEGWSIPTKEDWEDLGKALNGDSEIPFEKNWSGLGDNVMVNAKFNGTKFWAYNPNCNPENAFNWAALSGGSCTNSYNNYSGLMNYGFWWSATEMSSDKAFYRYIYCNRPDFDYNYTDKDGFAASVRCVKLK